MQNRRGKLILCMTAVFCAAAMICCGTKNIGDQEAVMEAAGQDVAKAEYQMILNSYAAKIKGQYTTKQANQKDFWTTKQEEGAPLEQIMQLAKEDLAHKKTVAKLAKDAGIDRKTDYASITKQMEEENDKRQKDSGAGEIVYGLTSFTAKDYYDYVYTEVEARLIESLKKKHEITDRELEQIYEENKEAYVSDVRVQMLVAEMRAQTGLEQARQAAEDMEQQTDAKRLADKYPEINFYEITMSSLNTQEGKSGAYTPRWQAASVMQEGEVCEPFSIGGNLMVMRCLERQEQEAEPFADVKGILKSEYLEGLARQEIAQQEQEAKVSLKVTQEQLEAVALQALE